MGKKLKILLRNFLSPSQASQPSLHLRAFKVRVVTLPLPLETHTLVGVLNRQRCKMSYAFTWLQTLERSFGLFSRDFTPEHIGEFIALLERVKTLLEAALPRARQRQAAQAQQARLAAQARDRLTDRWIKRTEKRARVLKISELKRPTEEPCGICLEHHTVEEMIACGCNHQFGKNCFLTMVKTNLSGSYPVLCPLCRVLVKSFSGFRQRASPKPRNPVAA